MSLHPRAFKMPKSSAFQQRESSSSSDDDSGNNRNDIYSLDYENCWRFTGMDEMASPSQ